MKKIISALIIFGASATPFISFAQTVNIAAGDYTEKCVTSYQYIYLAASSTSNNGGNTTTKNTTSSQFLSNGADTKVSTSTTWTVNNITGASAPHLASSSEYAVRGGAVTAATSSEVDILTVGANLTNSTSSNVYISTTTVNCYRPFDVYKIYITDFLFFAIVLVVALWLVKYLFGL